MAMSRRHFIRLAGIIREYKPQPLLVREIADMCGSENPRFDRYKFYEACGMFERFDKENWE